MIAELLKTGAENAINCSTLMEQTGHEKRTIYSLIERERDQGILICADTNGFYLPANQDEIDAFYHRYTAKSLKMLHTVRHFKRAAAQIEGQQTI